MPHDHPGFDYWDVGDVNHPFPVSEINLVFGVEDAAKATAELRLPVAQPRLKTVAERSIGIARSAKLWFALECTNAGAVTCEAVLRGQHVHWFPPHGETAVGAIQEIRLSMADMLGGGGNREAFAPHGPAHCDLFAVTWWPQQGDVHCELVVLHFSQTVEEFLEAREKNRREAERQPPPAPPYWIPPTPKPKPPPEPEPEPIPVSGPITSAGVIGWFLGLIRALLEATFRK